MVNSIDIHNVLFRRSRRTILADVSLSVGAGENWVLFGPNGIGKSTLVSMMSTRLFPTSGTVDILGNRLGRVNVFSYRSRIGLASGALNRDFSPLSDPLDVVVSAVDARLDNYYDAYDSDVYERARCLLRRYGIEYVAGKKMYKLSEGERTRVAICRALMTSPELLILDEPTTGLDLGGRELVVSALGELARGDQEVNGERPGQNGGRDDASGRQARSTILVTHRLEEIPPEFDHIAILGHVSESRARELEAEVGASEEIPADGGTVLNPAPGTIIYTGSIEEGLTSERLSDLFGMKLEVRRGPASVSASADGGRGGGRWSAFVAG
ncbi:ABC transporter ATP-binding protein [Alloscardovia macacae]|uniref:ABC transporter ATP-binding protein n=1 Tax=Alloscardovia macacae TaxID=1160091 RepID=A0A1Y2SWS5_9BIFI|nr:ATP-binding cassette domain-containing protein [Alloscardovia macacae]OTA25731.1 ABC transporter ATP-binding protein [Alloscardovia macacae]OTA28318.1 ABC transporter ATP-binding protein [Alloscardovia macacae]